VAAKLLLADDSVTLQRVIELTFADENVQVVAVGDGKAAIERVKTDRPDIVLADVGMPERDGYEVAAFIKGSPEHAHIPVLLLTGAFEPIDESRAKSVGCEGVLVKPFEPQMVISRVRELLGKKPRQAEAATPPPPAVEAAEPGQPEAAPQSADAPALEPAPAPTAAAQAPASQPAPKADALEDYFDRLDAALSTLNTAPPALEPVSSFAKASEDKPVEAPAVPAAKPAPTFAEAPAGMPPLHEAFAALLSAERGLPVHPNGPTREAITEDVIEEVVRRVMARMSNDSMRRAVLDAAERMVREEIERIKKTT
jgi:CheY-like chemotaxis protein